jgi:hypothetical protein
MQQTPVIMLVPVTFHSAEQRTNTNNLFVA